MVTGRALRKRSFFTFFFVIVALPIVLLFLAERAFTAISAGTSDAFDATADSNGRRVVRDTSNNIHVVYSNAGEIYYIKSTDSGKTWSAPLNLSSTGGNSTFPSIAVDSSNNLHVVWQDATPGNDDIYYKKYSGGSWSGITNISNNGANSWMPGIAIDTSNNIHAVWHDYTPGVNPDIYYSKYSAASWSAPAAIAATAGTSALPSVITDTSNNVHVLWADNSDGDYDVNYSKYTTSWSAPVNVSSNAGSSMGTSVASVTIDSSNNLYAVWHDDTSGNNEIYYSTYNGAAWSAAVNISSNLGVSEVPTISILGTTLYVVWQDDVTGDDDIWFSKYTGAWSGPVNLNSTAGVTSLYPSLPFKVVSTAPEMVWTEGNANPFTVTFQIVDTTAPSAVAAVNDGTGGDIDFVDATSQLSANWIAATDAESGIFKYWTGIGTAPGATDIAGWESAGSSLSTTRTGLGLVEGNTYYFTVKAENGGGLEGAVLNSDGQKVDTTDPVITLNDDTPDPFSPEGDTSQDTTGFAVTAADPGSGILDWSLGVYDGSCLILQKVFSGTGDPTPASPYVWDGKNSSGKLLANGDYCVRLVVRDNALNTNSITSPTDGAPGGTGIYISTSTMVSGNPTATAWHQSHKLVRDPGGWVDIVYASGGEIYYAYSTDGGSTWTKPVNISNTNDDSDYPAIAIYGSTIYVVWQEDVGGTNKEIYGVGFSPGAANPFGGSASNISNNSGSSEYPSIAVDSSGWIHVVWRDDTVGFRTGANPDIAWSLSTNGGTSFSAATNLSSNAGTSSGASIAAGASNRAYVVWWDDTTGNNEILYKRYSGGSWDASATNVSNNAGSSLEPAVVVDSSNKVHAVWQDDTGVDNDIYYKMYNGTSWDVSATDISNNGSDSAEPNIGFDASSGDVVAAWEDNLTGNYDIYYKKKGSYGWNINSYNVSSTVGVNSSYVSLNLKAVSTGIDAVWTEGNAAPYTIGFQRVDTIAPNVTSLTSPTHPSQATWYNNNTPQWDFTGTDNVGGTGLYGSWRLTSTNATETSLTVRTGTYQGTGVLTYTSGALADGINYFHLIYEDNAGNLSTVSTYTTRVDTSAPSQVATVNDGTGADVDLWYFPTYLSANWTTSTDNESGVTKYWYAIGTTQGGTELVGWTNNGTSTSVTKSGLTLVGATMYYFTVKAENGVGLLGIAQNSDGVTYNPDLTPPSNIATVRDGTLASDINFTSSATQLSANWTASSDAETGLAKYWYAIYQRQGACIDGVGPCGEANDTTIVGFTNNGTSTIVTKASLTLTTGQLYYFGIKAENGVGLQSAVTKSDGVTLDTTAPSVVGAVNDGSGADVDLQVSATTIDANWTAATDAESGICHYWVGIGTTPGGTSVAGWDDAGVLLATTRTGLSLVHNTTYYVSVKAENCAAYQSAYVASDGVKVDSQGPAVDTLTSSTHASQSSWYNSNLPSYTWSASDGTGESGLLSCYRLLDQTASPTASTVKTTGTAVGASGTFTQVGALADGTWYFHVVCEDNYNTLGAVRNYTTNIDTGIPTAIANVYDGAGADITTTAAVDEISANWTTSSDALSSIAKYWYAVYKRAGTCIDGVGPCVEADDVSIVSFYDNGTATNVTDTTVILTSGQTYYFAVKAQDGAGNQSAVTKSDGVLTNNNGPTILTLISSTHPAQTSWYTSTLPSYSWTAQDNGGSGIAKYWYVLNTTTSMSASQIKAANQSTTFLTFTQGAPKSDGTHYFHLVAEDNNGMSSPSETKYITKIDASGPSTIVSVYDGTSTGVDSDYSSMSTSFSANWTASSDSLSGIAKYFYSIYQVVGSCVDGSVGCVENNDTLVAGPTDNLTATSVTHTALTLTDGQKYYFSVKAQNGSGLQGTAKVSDGVTIDSTPPSAPSFVYDGTGADATFTSSLDTLYANWATSTDAQTNISKYYYAIYKMNGTCADGGTCAETDDTSLISFTSTGTTQSVTKASLTLSSGSLYYFAVKAENGAGGQSSVANSNGITVDTTAPAFSAVSSSTHPDQTKYYSVSLPALSWSASDNAGGSGISKYYYLLNQNASETAANVKATGTQAASTTTTFTQGTALTDGTYYFNLVVDDVMGNLSTLSQYKVNIDTGPPTITSIAAVSSAGSATISWTTSEAADSTVDYGTTTSYGSSAADTTLTTSHSVAISGLSAGLLYHYRVKSKDGAGNLSTSSDQTFTTTTDTQPPVLTSVTSATHPDSTKWVNNAKPAITWAATDDKGIAGAYILFDQTQTQTAAIVKSTGTLSVGTGTTSAGTYTQPANLSPDGVWYAHTVTMDNGGNLSNAMDYKLQIDTSTPSSVTVNDGTGTDIDFTNSTASLSAAWSPSSDSQSGIARYYLAIGKTAGGTDVMAFTDVGTVTTYTKTGLTLTAGTTYYMSVKAENGAGVQTSAASSDGVTIDTTAPKALSSTSSNETTVAVVFDEAMDKTSAQTTSNYTISPSLSVSKALLSDDGKTVTLTTSSQSAGRNYTVTCSASALKDLAGNTIASGSNTAAFKGIKTITFATGKTFISLPLNVDITNPEAFFGMSTGTSTFTLKGFDTATDTVKIYPDPFVSSFQLQKGYSLIVSSLSSPNPIKVNVTGTEASQVSSSNDRMIALLPGWNFIGNPFDATIPITSLSIVKGTETKTLEQAEASWWVGGFLWTYYDGSYQLVHSGISGALRNVEPWRGYLIFAIESCSLVFPSSSTAKAKEEETISSYGGLLWSAQISAQTSKAKDNFNFAGVSKMAERLLVGEPPHIIDDEDYVSVYFDEGGRKLTSYYKNSRSKEESMTFTVETNAKGETVDISFAFTGNTDGLEITLTDLSAMKQVTLNNEGKYAYMADGAPRQFRLDVKDKAKEEAKNKPLNITQLHNYPNPDRVGNTTFKYAVDGNAASVMIEVYTMTGKLIDKFSGELDGDTVWKFGDSLPNGVYVYRLIVVDVNGNKVSKINKLVVLK